MLAKPPALPHSKALHVKPDLMPRRLALSAIATPWGLMASGRPAWAGPAAHAPARETAAARVVTVTYLKSQPGRLAQLERFVRANWFAMDAVAVQQGLFVDYVWLDRGTDDGPWNAIVKVTYNDDKGFAGIEDRWAAIKAAHKEVRPDDLGFRDLGRVLETVVLYERAPFASGNAASARR